MVEASKQIRENTTNAYMKYVITYTNVIIIMSLESDTQTCQIIFGY
jgi:hypothetical protein